MIAQGAHCLRRTGPTNEIQAVAHRPHKCLQLNQPEKSVSGHAGINTGTGALYERTGEIVMRHVLTGLTLLAAVTAVAAPAQAHDRFHSYSPRSPWPPPARYVVPPPRYYYPPPAYYYVPGPVYAYPRPAPHRYYPTYRPYRPYHQTPQGSATFFFKF